MKTITLYLEKIAKKIDLSREEMKEAMKILLSDEIKSSEIAAFLMGLREKGESTEELLGALDMLHTHMLPVSAPFENLIDIVGTGGDGANLFNVSTTAAFVVAAAGGKVAKHGNRSASSQSGSADVLETAGAVLTLSPKQIETCIEKVGFGFMFAPAHHAATKRVSAVRKELGIRTFFNLLGPLANPALVKRYVLGVASKQWMMPATEVLKAMGCEHVIVMHSHDGLDEMSIQAPTDILEYKNSAISKALITPEMFGLVSQSMDEIKVKNAKESLKILKDVLKNKLGVARDVVLLNAGAAIYVANLAENMELGIQKAAEVMASGEAYHRFESFIKLTQELKS